MAAKKAKKPLAKKTAKPAARAKSVKSSKQKATKKPIKSSAKKIVKSAPKKGAAKKPVLKSGKPKKVIAAKKVLKNIKTAKPKSTVSVKESSKKQQPKNTGKKIAAGKMNQTKTPVKLVAVKTPPKTVQKQPVVKTEIIKKTEVRKDFLKKEPVKKEPVIQPPVKTETHIPKTEAPVKPPVMRPVKNVPMIKEVKREMIDGREKTRYSDEELQEFRELILKKLENSRNELKYLQEQISRKNDLGSDDSDLGFKGLEDGTGTVEREYLNQMASRQIKYISDLERALIRIENKTYGICRETGRLISKERLRAVPHATLSIEAKLGKG